MSITTEDHVALGPEKLPVVALGDATLRELNIERATMDALRPVFIAAVKRLTTANALVARLMVVSADATIYLVHPSTSECTHTLSLPAGNEGKLLVEYDLDAYAEVDAGETFLKRRTVVFTRAGAFAPDLVLLFDCSKRDLVGELLRVLRAFDRRLRSIDCTERRESLLAQRKTMRGPVDLLRSAVTLPRGDAKSSRVLSDVAAKIKSPHRERLLGATQMTAPTAPTAPTTTPQQQVPAEDVRRRISAVYRRYAPEKLASVDTLMAKYSGKETPLLHTIVHKYVPLPLHGAALRGRLSPPPPPPPSAGGGGDAPTAPGLATAEPEKFRAAAAAPVVNHAAHLLQPVEEKEEEMEQKEVNAHSVPLQPPPLHTESIAERAPTPAEVLTPSTPRPPHSEPRTPIDGALNAAAACGEEPRPLRSDAAVSGAAHALPADDATTHFSTRIDTRLPAELARLQERNLCTLVVYISSRRLKTGFLEREAPLHTELSALQQELLMLCGL